MILTADCYQSFAFAYTYYIGTENIFAQKKFVFCNMFDFCVSLCIVMYVKVYKSYIIYICETWLVGAYMGGVG